MTDHVISRDIQVVGYDGEWGLIFVVVCPRCADRVRVVLGDTSARTCACGLTWSLELHAHGHASHGDAP